MVSRQDTARPLLTPGEVMQLPPGDELVLVSGIPPIRAYKARYYDDRRLKSRVVPPPAIGAPGARSATRADDWPTLPIMPDPVVATAGRPAAGSVAEDPANGGIRREPALPEHEAIAPEGPAPNTQFPLLDDEPDDDDVPAKAMRFRSVARQAALDPDDGLGL